jgi:hypothetical protein
MLHGGGNGATFFCPKGHDWSAHDAAEPPAARPAPGKTAADYSGSIPETFPRPAPDGLRERCVEWFRELAADLRAEASQSRRYAEWLASAPAQLVPDSEKFGTPDQLEADAVSGDEEAAMYEYAAAALARRA